MLLTFRTGQEALAAVCESAARTVSDEQLIVALQTPDWCDCVQREFSLIRCASAADTYSATSNSLLGEDFSIPSMSFDDMDGNCNSNAVLNIRIVGLEPVSLMIEKSRLR